jgi:hypothetical protein
MDSFPQTFNTTKKTLDHIGVTGSMGGMGEVWEIRQHKKWGMGQHLAGLTPGYQGRCNSRNMAMTVPLEVRGLGLEEIKVPENLDTND